MIRERNGIKELEIFWSFEKDSNLPKFKKNVKVHYGNSGDNEGVGGGFITTTSVSGSATWNTFDASNNENFPKMNFLRRFFLYLYNKFVLPKKVKKENDRKFTTILDFFTSLSSSFKELTPIGEIAETYQKALDHAMTTGQVSLQEKITNIVDVARTEAHLIENELNKYVTEQQIIDFFEATSREKKLKLTLIKNFAKVIPSDIVDLKKKLDEKELFDNYVVLHYDPNGDATILTEKEKEIKKDPILFGLLQNSRKLYYVGDWKDEYCDLTLEDMFSKLGEKTLTINNDSVKTFINTAGSYEQERVKLNAKKTQSRKK